MDMDILQFFDGKEHELKLFIDLYDKMSDSLPEFKYRVSKTQISFSNKYGFVFVSLPVRRVKGRPDRYIIVTFGLESELQHPRIEQTVEPYPNRWTHHVIVSDTSEIDSLLLGWIKQAYDFSAIK